MSGSSSSRRSRRPQGTGVCQLAGRRAWHCWWAGQQAYIGAVTAAWEARVCVANLLIQTGWQQLHELVTNRVLCPVCVCCCVSPAGCMSLCSCPKWTCHPTPMWSSTWTGVPLEHSALLCCSCSVTTGMLQQENPFVATHQNPSHGRQGEHASTDMHTCLQHLTARCLRPVYFLAWP